MWKEQKQGNTKLVVYFNDTEPQKMQVFHSFEAEDKKGTAIAGLTRRILEKHVFGRYKTAIFYRGDVEVERWVSGIKQKQTT